MSNSPTLARAIGRWSLTALVINSVVGSSVFGLPSVIAGKLGAASPWAWGVAALGMGIVMLCFAEVASRYTQAGGPYLYARMAFGRLAGIEMGWLSYLVRLTAAATNANLFVIYLGEFWPEASGPALTPLVLALLLAPLAVVNLRGVSGGAATSNLFAVLKVAPLVLFGALGTAVVLSGRGIEPAVVAAGGATWLDATLLLVFAYGGFEAALMPMSEAKDPRRDAPFALLAALLVIALIYGLVQVAVVFTLPDAAQAARPVAAAAGHLAGPAGATVMALTALVSVTGYLASAALNVPRLTYAMAEQGDLPAFFRAVHPRFRTPWISLLIFVGLVWILAASGSFLQNLTLSAASRLFTYAAVCLAVLRLRRGDHPPASFRLPAAPLLALIGTAFSLLLVARITTREGVVLAVTLALGAGTWVWARLRERGPSPD